MRDLTLKQTAPVTTTSERTGSVFEHRGLYAYHQGEIAGYLRVGRILAGKPRDDQRFFGPHGRPIAYVSYRETFLRLDDTRLGDLLVPEAHTRWREELGPLHSGYSFVNTDAKQVWKRLTAQNKAVYTPFRHDGQAYERWRLL